MAGVKGNRGGQKGRSGRKPYAPMPPATRDRIRSGMALDVVEKISAGELKGDPKVLAVRLNAATVLLRKTLPDLTATDITSKGKQIIVEAYTPVAQSTATEKHDDDAT